MAVYFVYRCHYGAPSEKHVRRFEYDTVLDWAKAVWKQFDDDDVAYEYGRELLGGLSVYSFGGLFYAEPGQTTTGRPQTMADVHDWFQSMYDPTPANGPHHVQIRTDDDELEMAVYVFDDHYRAANPGKADFLLLDGWELPDGDADGTFPIPEGVRLADWGGAGVPGVSVTFAAFLDYDGSDNLDLYGAVRVAGVRVPDLARYSLTEWADSELEGDLETCRRAIRDHVRGAAGDDAGFLAAIRDDPDEATHWAAYTDWLAEHDEPEPG